MQSHKPFGRSISRRSAAWFAAASLLLCNVAGVHAQATAGRTITIVVPYTPGSGVDTVARAVAEPLREMLNQVVVVENRVGASGNIGTYSVARAAPDGTTLLMAANTIVLNVGLFKNLNYNPLTSFAPVMEVATGHMALATNAALPPNTLQEFIAFAKNNSTPVNYSSPGRGTPHHLAMELLKNSAGVELTHVPYNGLAKAISDLVGGHVSAMFVGVNSIMPLANDKKVKVLGVSSLQRAASAPQVPTIAEQGLPGFEVESWFSLLAPAGTPRETVERINFAMNEILKRPEIVTVLAKQGLNVVGGSPDRLGQLLQSDLTKWLKVIKDAGISPE
jgi:tripartite-type tricarboxylate transporter receptor subunit TctC